MPSDPAIRFLHRFDLTPDDDIGRELCAAFAANPALGDTATRLLDERWLHRNLAPRTIADDQWILKRYERFCAQHDLPAWPATPMTVAAYASVRLQTVTAATVEHEIGRIAGHCLDQGWDDPRIEDLALALEGAARSLPSEPGAVSQPVSLTDLRCLVDTLDHGFWSSHWSSTLPERVELQRRRWRSLLLVGWASAVEPGDLFDLRWQSITLTANRLDVCLSPTADHPDGRIVTITAADSPYCPVTALIDWAKAVARSGGPPSDLVFPLVQRHGPEPLIDPFARYLTRTGATGEPADVAHAKALASLVSNENNRFKRLVAASGIAEDGGRITLGSLRAGFAEEAIRAGVDVDRVRRHLGQRSPETTWRTAGTAGPHPLEALAS